MPTRKPKIVFQRRPPTADDQLAAAVSSLKITPNPVSRPTSNPGSAPSGPPDNGRRNRFDEMGLKAELLQGIQAYALVKPASIQELAIVPGTQGKDLILQAQSGMGKTAAMVIITLQRIRPYDPTCQAMVLVPTRELALQVWEVFVQLGKFMKVRSEVYIGGTGKSQSQNEKLKRGGIHVLVGTLGRLAHIIRERIIDSQKLEIFVLDEADKMLTDGSFKSDIKLIISEISSKAQVILMSATMPKTALKYSNQITRKPKIFLIPSYQLTLEGIKQFYVDVGDEDETKLETLHELLPIVARKHTIVFCSTRNRVRTLFKKLMDRGHVVGSIEGEQNQECRLSALKRFRFNAVSTLISSELLGRGIDVQQVYVVINYDLPGRVEEYIHRVGRAGRYGRQGIAITFVRDRSQVEKLERFYDTKIDEMPADIATYMV